MRQWFRTPARRHRSEAAGLLMAVVFGVAGPVHGDETPVATPPNYGALQDRFIWGGVADARPVSPFFGIPREVSPAYGFARSYMDSTPGRSVAFAALFYGSEEGEEAVVDSAAGMKQGNPMNPSLIRCDNPDVGRGTQHRLNFPVRLGQSISAGGQNAPRGLGTAVGNGVEVATGSTEARSALESAFASLSEAFGPGARTFGDSLAKAGESLPPPEGAPGAEVRCTDRLGTDSTTWSGAIHGDGFTVGSGIGASSTRFHHDQRRVVSEARSIVHDVNLGTVRIPFIASTVRVEIPADGKPTLSYRVRIADVLVDGESLFHFGPEGLLLAGQALAPGEVVQQFTQQAKAAGQPLAELASYGIVIAAPQLEEHEASHEYTARAPVVEFTGRPGPSAKVPENLPAQPPLNFGHGRLGDRFGMRFGDATVAAKLREIAS
jgi:hypothetical protein